jgi:anti-sigma B factor antagonist
LTEKPTPQSKKSCISLYCLGRIFTEKFKEGGGSNEDLANSSDLPSQQRILPVIVRYISQPFRQLIATQRLKSMLSLLVRPENAVICPQGHVNAANASILQERLSTAVLSETNVTLLVDMSQVESLDSAGLMAFVSAMTLAQRLGKRFSLCAIPPAIRIIFELTQLDRVFEIFETAAEFNATVS